MSAVRHLYVHLPFCAARCGYCDFVTAVGREEQHEEYVDALLTELDLERGCIGSELETVYLGGGTPTFTRPNALRRLLESLPPARELTVEANPETVTPALAALLHEAAVNRISLGAQSFQPHLLSVLERGATPEAVRGAVYHLRDAGFDNVSLDLIYGVPGQSAADLDRDLAEALALEPDHLSAYELEAKPGTRFTHRHGAELARQAESMESYFERVVATLTAAGYRWYETANFCLTGARARGRDLRSRHNLAYWLGRDYLALGVGAVSTIENVRRRNTPGLPAYLRSLGARTAPPRELEVVEADVRSVERVMLGLRLDEPLPLHEVEGAVDAEAVDRLERLGLARRGRLVGQETLELTPRGRFVGDAVTAELVV
jgi:putative oxygen-independent coproporphyrinogen III oxidase